MTDPLAPPTPFAALLFDCDGTLVDTLPAYERAWECAFGSVGHSMSRTWYRQRTGLSPDALVDAAVAENAQLTDKEAVQASAARHFEDLVEHVRCNERVADVARAHHGRVPMAVVSGGPGVAVRAALTKAGVLDLFDAVVTVDDVARGKPAPDLYLAALDRLGCGPDDCVAYEDSEEGIAAAQAAGIRCIDVRPHLSVAIHAEPSRHDDR